MYKVWVMSLLLLGLGMQAQEYRRPPEFAVPLVAQAPQIDGRLEAAEWQGAAVVHGFVMHSGHQLDSRGMQLLASYDRTHLYLGFRAPNYPAGKKPKATWSRRDFFPPVGFEEDRIEILLDPHFGQHTVEKGHFMVFFNAAGKIVYDQQWTEAEGVQKDWNLQARLEAQRLDEVWEAELAIPFAELGISAPENGQTWFLQASRYWSDFGSWTTLSPAASILNSHQGGATIRFSPGAPGYEVRLQPTAEALLLTAQLGGGAAAGELTATLQAGSEKRPALTQAVPAGPASALRLGPLAETNQVSIVLTSGETPLYQAEIPFLRDPVLPKFDPDQREKQFMFLCRYLPYHQKAWIDLIDYSEHAQAAEIGSADFLVLQGERELFRQSLNLTGGKLENQAVLLPGVIRADGTYQFAVSLRRQGNEVLREAIPYEFINFPFVGSRAGLGVEIMPGFTPLRWQDDSADMVSSRIQWQADGLPRQIVARQSEPTVGGVEEELLAGPVRLTGIVDGVEVNLSGTGLQVLEQSPSVVQLGSTGRLGPVPVRVHNRLEYDGLAWISLTLDAAAAVRLEALTLEIPLQPARATLMYEITDKRLGFSAGQTAAADGVVWDSMRNPNTGGTYGNFKPMVWVGNEDMGLTWCAESDRSWSLDERRPALQLVRQAGQVVLRVHFVNRPLELQGERTFSFGLHPTPSKPMPAGWRSWLVGADPKLPNIQSFYYSAAVSHQGESAQLHAYCSYNPYPASYDEARAVMDKYREQGYTFLRYQLMDWIRYMKEVPEGRVYQGEWERVWMNSHTRSFQDFKAYHYDQYLKKVGFFTVYEDEAYLRPMRDLALDAGYRRPDGEIQSEFGIRGLRETLRRCAAVWVENGMPNRYAVHKSGVTMSPCHSFAAISIDGEQRFMDNPNRDYIDNWPLDFVRSHVMGRQFGVVPVFLSEVRLTAQQYGVEKIRQANRSMMTLLLLHDIIAWHAWNAHAPTRDIVHRAKSDFAIGGEAVRFHPYWSAPAYQLARSADEQVKVSVWKQGDQLFLVAGNLGDSGIEAEIELLPEQCGYAVTAAVDYETQNSCLVAPNRLRVAIPRHDFRMIFAGRATLPAITARRQPPVVLPEAETAPAAPKAPPAVRPEVPGDLLLEVDFDNGAAARTPRGAEPPLRLRGTAQSVPGRAGGGALVIGADAVESLEYTAAGNFFGPEGSLVCTVSPLNYGRRPDSPKGIYHLFYLTSGPGANRWGVQLQREADTLRLLLLSSGFSDRKNIYLTNEAVSAWQNGTWHQVAVTWDAEEIFLYIDGLVAGRSRLETPYTVEDFAGKVIKAGYESGLPGRERTAIDDLRVYCRKLTAAEIMSAYEKGLGPR